MKTTIFFILSFVALAFAACNFFPSLAPVTAKPTFDELTVSNVTATGFYWKSRKIVTDRNGYDLSEIGVMYSTNPDIPVKTSQTDGTAYAVGYFDYQNDINGLLPNTTYYVCLYCITNSGTCFKGEPQIITTRQQGNYSQAKVKSPINDNVELGLIGCWRMKNKVLVEVTIKNTGINDTNDLRIFFSGCGQTVDGKTYTTHVEDDLYTDYLTNDVLFSMNGNRDNHTDFSAFFSAGSLPLNATRRLQIHVFGVPENTQKLDLYIMSYFYNYSGCPAVYMTFENVPIY